MNKKILAIIIVSSLLITILPAVSTCALKRNTSNLTVNATVDYKEYTNDGGIISIGSDEEFKGHPAVTPGGTGYQINPYVIENWRVKKINIKYTNCYFKINHCLFYNVEGVYFEGVQNGIIQDCFFEKDESFGTCGIKLFWSGNNEIKDCVIKNYIWPLYLASFSTNNLIDNCKIFYDYDKSPQSYGITLANSNNNQITNCRIIVNHFYENYGLGIFGSNGNIIKQSIIEGTCEYGIFIKDESFLSYANTFLHNSIKNNDAHVNIGGWSNNNWCNGVEGNYWSQYNKDDKNRDGIGDEPYYGDGYPLIKPYGTPFPPTIRFSGGEKGAVGKAYDYFFKTKDHNNDMVYYTIDWGDNSPYEKVGPYNSNQETPAGNNIHIYTKKGDYTIRAKAMDVNGDESDWSAGFTVTMQKSKSFIFLKFNSLLEKLSEFFPNLRK